MLFGDAVKLALLFPGQGSQFVGMGRDVFDASPAARSVYEAADGALDGGISRLCFEGPEEELTMTANTQPALVTTSIALLSALRERFPALPPPACAAGHSLGEYSALVAAGALALDDAVRLVRVRGKLMQESVPAGQGAMAAVMGLSPEEVEQLCLDAAAGDVVAPANFNGTQIVIAGAAAAVARASELVVARKGKAIPLKVSAPFHCALMRPAAEAIEPLLASTRVGPFSFPVVANVDALPNEDPARVRSLLARQIDGVVRWEASIRWMEASGVTHALEVGPGKVLAGLVKRIARGIAVLPCGDLAQIDSAGKQLTQG
jgi:[acyl-carrier-protein] S-malonyltransferase